MAKLLTTRELIASEIANARGMRRGAPSISNVLDILPEKLKNEVLDDADNIIVALKKDKEQLITELNDIKGVLGIVLDCESLICKPCKEEIIRVRKQLEEIINELKSAK
jgi:hypothetical protein